MGFLKRGETGPTPEQRQVINDRLEQSKRQVKDAPRSRESLLQAMQANKDRAAKLAQGQTETPNPNAASQAEKPLNRGTPAEAAAKDALLKLPPEERLNQNKDQAISALEQQRDAAAQAEDVEEFRRLNNLIRRLKTPSTER